MRKYDIIFWDVDDTLLDFKRSADYALRKACEQYGICLSDAMILRYMQINQSYWKRLELGEADKLTVLRNRFFDFFEEYHIKGIEVEEFRAVYQKQLGCVYYYLEESDRLLQELKQRGIRQYIVTNGVAETQRNKLRLSGIDKLTDGLFISEELGFVKPELGFFEACFEKIPDFDKERSILAGDSLSSDIKGANRAGIASCWYCPHRMENHSESKPDYTIQSLWDIKAVL